MSGVVTTLGGWEVAPETDADDIAWKRGRTTRVLKARPQMTTHWSEAVPIGTIRPVGVEEALQTVRELATMPAGWDGYRSPAIGKPAIEGALNLLTEIEELQLPKPHVSPVAGGGVQVEWEKAGKELELEFREDGALSYLKTDAVGEDDEEGSLSMEHRQKLFTLFAWLAE